MDEIEPKFGEWLRGIYASESNPRRDGMYVRTIISRGRMNPGKFYEVTDGNGNFWVYPAQSVERIAAALRSAQAPQWQPIETAPKDGTPILGLWMPSPGTYTRVSGNNYGITAFDDDAGFWSLVDDGDEPDEVMRPDFWMPLPAAPSAEGV